MITSIITIIISMSVLVILLLPGRPGDEPERERGGLLHEPCPGLKQVFCLMYVCSFLSLTIYLLLLLLSLLLLFVVYVSGDEPGGLLHEPRPGLESFCDNTPTRLVSVVSVLLVV